MIDSDDTAAAQHDLTIERIHRADDGHAVEFDVSIRGETNTVYFRSGDIELTPNIEAIVTPMILPAMVTGSRLRIDRPVSAKFLANLSVIQDIFSTWEPWLERIDIKARANAPGPAESGERVGAFFTGGIDSFYTLTKHVDEITDLIFVHGYDIPLEKTSLRAEASAAIHRIAEVFGKNVIEIETNLEPLIGQFSGWVNYNLGAAVASAGHMLAPAFRRIYIPATYTYAELVPCGTHPMLDPLWSSDALEFVHDGCEAPRMRKVRTLVRYDVALKNLRVCWQNLNGAYNCGLCGKCTRTMIYLRAAGALDRCPTFDAPLTLRRVAMLDGADPEFRSVVVELVEALEADDRPEDRRLLKVLRRTLRGKSWFAKLKDGVTARLLDKPRLFSRLQPAYQKVAGIFWPKLPPSSRG